LSIDDTVDWDAIKRKDAFRIKPEMLYDDRQVPNFLRFIPLKRILSFGEP
jgi:hypothetical protein